jgi:hypothetical protein
MQPVYRQQIGKHVPAAMITHITIELLLETVFITRSVQSGYKEDNWGDPINPITNSTLSIVTLSRDIIIIIIIIISNSDLY